MTFGIREAPKWGNQYRRFKQRGKLHEKDECPICGRGVYVQWFESHKIMCRARKRMQPSAVVLEMMK